MSVSATETLNGLAGKSFDSFSDAAATVLELLEAQLPGSVVYLAHLDDEENEMRIIDARGGSSFGLEQGSAKPLDETFCRLMAFNDAPRLANRPEEIEVYRHLPSRVDVGIGSYLGVPLETGDGVPVCSLCALSHEADSFTDEDLRLIGLMGRMLALHLESEQEEHTLAAATEHLRELSGTDPLTGALNRRGLAPVLEREWKLAGRSSISSFLLIADVDHFKRINDEHGRAHGDRTLQLVAKTLGDCSRSTDIVARIGGDEFAVVLVGAKGEQPTPYVQRVTKRLADHGQAPTLSFGWSKLSIATSPQHAFELADGLMYRRRAVSGGR